VWNERANSWGWFDNARAASSSGESTGSSMYGSSTYWYDKDTASRSSGKTVTNRSSASGVSVSSGSSTEQMYKGSRRRGQGGHAGSGGVREGGNGNGNGKNAYLSDSDDSLYGRRRK